MTRTKAMARKAAAKAKQLAAEIIGDGELNAEGKAQERRAEAERDEPADDLNPLSKLKRLT